MENQTPIAIPDGTYTLTFTGPLQQGQPAGQPMGSLTVQTGMWSFSLDNASQSDRPVPEQITHQTNSSGFTLKLTAGNVFGLLPGNYDFTAKMVCKSGDITTVTGGYSYPSDTKADDGTWTAMSGSGAETEKKTAY